jgi:hypothetical protein
LLQNFLVSYRVQVVMCEWGWLSKKSTVSYIAALKGMTTFLCSLMELAPALQWTAAQDCKSLFLPGPGSGGGMDNKSPPAHVLPLWQMEDSEENMPSRQSDTLAEYLLLAKALGDIGESEEADAAANLPKPAAAAAFAGVAAPAEAVTTSTWLPPLATAAVNVVDGVAPAPWGLSVPPSKEGNSTKVPADNTTDIMDVEDAVDYLLLHDSPNELSRSDEEAFPSVPECEGLFWGEEGASRTNSTGNFDGGVAAV